MSWDNSKGEIFLLGLADINHNVNEHAGVDEQANKDWKVEPDELVHTTVEVTASETNRVISGHHFIKLYQGSKVSRISLSVIYVMVMD